jgi:flagellar hook assembly protein FlgD
MNTKKLFLTFAISAVSLLSYNVYGQIGTSNSNDTVQSARQELKEHQAADKTRIDDANNARKQTRSDAKVTQRVNRDAMDASREAKKAYRNEKKAQKARKNADKQAKKAADARDKSDNN